MFLNVTQARNSELLIAAALMHQQGIIGPDTFVLDIDRIRENSRLIATAAERASLSLYYMTKQDGRNPFLARAALEGGIPAAVAVDVREARTLHGYTIPLGHLGHLVQIPRRDIVEIVGLHPEVVTVFSVSSAHSISTAAAAAGRVQSILLRVLDPEDFRYAGQEGGFTTGEIVDVAGALARLPGIRIAGVTTFPCLLFNPQTEQVELTPNFATLLRAADMLRSEAGLDVWQVNAPSVTCAATVGLLASHGATHGEPGSALTGHTPLHAAGTQPELPASVYVSEIAATASGVAYCYGGGFYARSRVKQALLFHGRTESWTVVDVEPPPAGSIDYYCTVRTGGRPVKVGDTVVFAFRAQAFVSRSHVAAVGGISRDMPQLLGICNAMGDLLGDDQLPVGGEHARDVVDEVWSRYSTGCGPAPVVR